MPKRAMSRATRASGGIPTGAVAGSGHEDAIRLPFCRPAMDDATAAPLPAVDCSCKKHYGGRRLNSTERRINVMLILELAVGALRRPRKGIGDRGAALSCT